MIHSKRIFYAYISCKTRNEICGYFLSTKPQKCWSKARNIIIKMKISVDGFGYPFKGLSETTKYLI